MQSSRWILWLFPRPVMVQNNLHLLSSWAYTPGKIVKQLKLLWCHWNCLIYPNAATLVIWTGTERMDLTVAIATIVSIILTLDFRSLWETISVVSHETIWLLHVVIFTMLGERASLSSFIHPRPRNSRGWIAENRMKSKIVIWRASSWGSMSKKLSFWPGVGFARERGRIGFGADGGVVGTRTESESVS